MANSKDEKMVSRIISSIVLIGITALMLLILPDWVFAVGVAVFAAAGMMEFFLLIERKGIPAYRIFGIIMGITISLVTYFRFETTRMWDLALVTAVLLILFALQIRRLDSSQAVMGISVTLFGILYISWLLTYLIKLRQLPGGTGLVVFLILVTKSGDVGAFLAGTKFGRYRLIKRISPQKTIEGMLGGLLFSVVFSLLGGSYFLGTVGKIHLIFTGLFIGFLGQIGDLSESLIKRDCGAKDSSSLIPGLGGVLDLIDSVLFSAPVFYFFVLVFGRAIGLQV